MKRVITFFLLSITAANAQPDVDMREGAFRTSHTDLKIQIGKNETWELKRNYNSRSTTIGLFGLGWCSDLDKKITVVEPDYMIFQNCSGDQILHYKSSLRFPTAEPPAVLVADGDSSSHIARIANGYLRRSAGFMTERYDSKGQLVAFTLSLGREVLVSRTVSGLPLRLTLPGKVHVEVRSNSGRIQSVRGPLGFEVSYQYEGALLKSVKLPTGQDVKLDYDEGQNLKSIAIPGKPVESITYDLELDAVTQLSIRDGCTHSFEYQMLQGAQVSHSRKICPKAKAVVRAAVVSLPVNINNLEGVASEE